MGHNFCKPYISNEIDYIHTQHDTEENSEKDQNLPKESIRQIILCKTKNKSKIKSSDESKNNIFSIK